MENNDETAVNRWADARLGALDQDREWRPDLARGWALLRERQIEEHHRTQKHVWIAATAVALCAALIAIPATRAIVEHWMTARNLPGPSVVYIQPEGRKIAPDFTLIDASGEPVSLSSERGKVILLNFWATWCAPCKTEIPWFVEFERTHKKAGFEVVGVSLDDDGWKSVKPFLEEKRVNYRMVVGDERVTGLYGGVPSLPATLVIDRSGRIAAVQAGPYNRNEIDAVLSEQ